MATGVNIRLRALHHSLGRMHLFVDDDRSNSNRSNSSGPGAAPWFSVAVERVL